MFEQCLGACPGYWLLCLMRMRWASIHLQVGHNLRTETIMHDHATYSMLQSALRVFPFKGLAQRLLLQATWVLGVTIVDFLIQAIARHRNFVSIDYNHKITALQVWREGRFMLATQDLRDLRCQTA